MKTLLIALLVVVPLDLVSQHTGGGMPNVQNLSRALVHQALVDP